MSTATGTPSVDVALGGSPSGSRSTPARDWVRVVAVAATALALSDVVFMALIATVVPPLVVAVVLTGVGLGLLGRRRRAGLALLGATTLLMLVMGLPFAVDHLGHPESGVDWFHAVVGVVGRGLLFVAVAAAWRADRRAADAGGSAPGAARIAGAVGVALLGAVATVALVATATTSGDEMQSGDLELVVDATAFPDRLTVASGDVVFVDNRHIFRHTFTVEDTDLDVELPALQGVRVPIDLATGTYSLICDVPGHEEMVGTLEVTTPAV